MRKSKCDSVCESESERRLVSGCGCGGYYGCGNGLWLVRVDVLGGGVGLWVGRWMALSVSEGEDC